MPVKARVTEAVVVVRVPQVVDDVTFQRGVGPYALVALVSGTIRLPGVPGRRRGPAGRVRLITVRACTTFPRRGRIKSLRLTHSPFPSPILRSFPSPFEDTSSRVSPYVSLWAGTRVRTNLTSLTKLH